MNMHRLHVNKLTSFLPSLCINDYIFLAVSTLLWNINQPDYSFSVLRMQWLFVISCFTCNFSYLKHLPRIRQIDITCPILNNEMYYKHGKGNIISTVWSPLQSDSVKNKSTIYVKFEKIWTPSDTCAWYMKWREKAACAPQP